MRVVKLMISVCCAALFVLAAASTRGVGSQSFTEAPAGYDGVTNGLADQATYDDDRKTYAEQETIADGLGPVYNAQSCGECHQNPVAGGASQVTVLRAGHLDQTGNFVEAPGGSLIHDRAIDPRAQESVPQRENIRTQRMSLSTLGDGYVEAIDDRTLVDIANRQARESRGQIMGQIIQVPLLEAPGLTRAGRFGWKNQHASLLSFSADAYLNEMGITSPFLPTENTSLGRSVAEFDKVADPEDDGEDIQKFARFMRGTKVPPRDQQLAGTPDAQMGSMLFNQIGCALCHTPSITTAPPGTPLNGGTFTVPDALGNKVIHPFGDFLLHDVGTGDGIVQNGGPETAKKLRTAPLWGLRTRTRLMHDGQSLTVQDAILRHAGEASFVINNFNRLAPPQRNQLLTFLRSL
jgi:CxxC motif-containing protein (DUF1111 family)